MPTALGTIASHRTATAATIPTTGLQLHLDADDASTFTYSSGVVVSQWRDKSGANHHGDVAGQPPTRNGTMNGRTTVRFSGTQFLVFVGGWASTFTAAEVFMAIRNITENQGGFFGGWGTSGQLAHTPFVDGVFYEGWGSTVRHVLGNPVAVTTDPFIYNLRTASGSYVAKINNEALSSNEPSNTVGFSAGSYSIVQNVAGSMANADIGEVIFYNRVLSTVERQQVESYLTAKWIPVGTGDITIP